MVWILFLVLLQSPGIKPEYNPQLDRTYYTADTRATDASGRTRRVRLMVNHKGKKTDGDLRYALSIELRAVATPKEFEEILSATCNDKQLFRRAAKHWLGTFDAETPKALVELQETEASVLTKCSAPKLTVAGITVSLSAEQMMPIRQAIDAARQ